VILHDLALAFFGGGLGSLMRWGVGLAVGRWARGSDLPWPTFAVNVSGCFLIGLLAPLVDSVGFVAGQPLGPLVLTGFLGGYTTFSSMELEASVLWSRLGRRAGANYLLLSVVAGGAAALAGAGVARWL
jgi:CrcB protein